MLSVTDSPAPSHYQLEIINIAEKLSCRPEGELHKVLHQDVEECWAEDASLWGAILKELV